MMNKYYKNYAPRTPKEIKADEEITMKTRTESIKNLARIMLGESATIRVHNTDNFQRYSSTNFAFVIGDNVKEILSEFMSGLDHGRARVKIVNMDANREEMKKSLKSMMYNPDEVIDKSGMTMVNLNAKYFVEQLVHSLPYQGDTLYLIEGDCMGKVMERDMDFYKRYPIIGFESNNLAESEGRDLSLIEVFKTLWTEAIAKEQANVPLQEVGIRSGRKYGVSIDDEGTILIKKRKDVDFMDAYAATHKLLKEYHRAGNTEAMKYELAKLWYMLIIIESEVLYVKGMKKMLVSEEKQREAGKARSFIINDFKMYLRYVLQHEKNFNFQEYFNTTPFGEDVIKLDKKTIDVLKSLFTMIF